MVSFVLWTFQLPMHNFDTSYIDHLGNTGSMNYANLSTVVRIYHIKKNHSVVFPLIKKVLSYIGALSGLQWHIQVFLNPDFFLKARMLSFPTNTISYFPYSDRLITFTFEKMSARYPSLNYYSLSILSRNTGVPWKKQLSHLATETMYKCSFLRQSYIWYWTKVLYTSYFVTQKI